MQQNFVHFLFLLRLNPFILTLFLTFLAFIWCIFLTNPFLIRIHESTNATCTDYSYGKWVWDEGLPGEMYTEKCPFLDLGFRCQRNGRPDLNYQKWRWQPHGCRLPRFDAKDFLRRSQNGRIVFAGDSIGRNQWESFLCMLAQGVSNLSKVYEEHGHPITKHKGFLSIKFQEYNITVQYYRVPYLVTVNRPPASAPKKVKGVIQVDKLHWFSSKWAGADVLIFSVGHWWSFEKTLKSGHYFQEKGKVNMTMPVVDAFERSLYTLKSWITRNLQAGKSHVFFRSYPPIHYRNGTWDKGGYCHTVKEPETEHSKQLQKPENNVVTFNAVKQMKHGFSTVKFINITYLSDLREDGHPSIYREQGTSPEAPQDCSHWCLPGVPDTWNEIVYAELLKMGFSTMTCENNRSD